MSVVAVKKTPKEIQIAADSIVLYDDQYQRKNGVKLWSANEMTIGSTGSLEEITAFKVFTSLWKPQSPTIENIFCFMSEFAKWREEKTGKAEISNDFIIVFGGTVFEISGFDIQEIKDYAAIGAGDVFAITALYLGKTPKEACETSIHLSPYCESPVNSIQIKIK